MDTLLALRLLEDEEHYRTTRMEMMELDARAEALLTAIQQRQLGAYAPPVADTRSGTTSTSSLAPPLRVEPRGGQGPAANSEAYAPQDLSLLHPLIASNNHPHTTPSWLASLLSLTSPSAAACIYDLPAQGSHDASLLHAHSWAPLPSLAIPSLQLPAPAPSAAAAVEEEKVAGDDDEDDEEISAEVRAQLETGTRWDEPTPCTRCKRMFPNKYQAKKHFMRLHYRGKKRHVCERCGTKSFAMKEDLTTHLKACGRVFPCSCGRKLRTKATLKRHCRLTAHTPISLEGFDTPELSRTNTTPAEPEVGDEGAASTDDASKEEVHGDMRTAVNDLAQAAGEGPLFPQLPLADAYTRSMFEPLAMPWN